MLLLPFSLLCLAAPLVSASLRLSAEPVFPNHGAKVDVEKHAGQAQHGALTPVEGPSAWTADHTADGRKPPGMEQTVHDPTRPNLMVPKSTMTSGYHDDGEHEMKNTHTKVQLLEEPIVR